MAEHGGGHGHGHESADKKHGKHNEWIGTKTKEALGVGLGSMLIAKAAFLSLNLVVPGYLIGLLGFMGVGAYMFGTRKAAGGGGHGGHKGGAH